MTIRTRNAHLFLALALAVLALVVAVDANHRLAELEPCLCLVDGR